MHFFIKTQPSMNKQEKKKNDLLKAETKPKRNFPI